MSLLKSCMKSEFIAVKINCKTRLLSFCKLFIICRRDVTFHRPSLCLVLHFGLLLLTDKRKSYPLIVYSL